VTAVILIAVRRSGVANDARCIDNRDLRTRTNVWLGLASSVVGGCGTVVNSNDYGYDSLGRRVTHTIWNGANCTGTLTYSYDLLDRLSTMTVSGSLPLSNTTWNYDAVGNRTSVVVGGVTTTYGTANILNQYPSVGGVAYSYDSKGNLTGDGTRTMGYDADNLLTSVSVSGLTTAFAYDWQHHVVKRVRSGQTIRYIYDASWRVLEEIDQATGQILKKYIYGPGIDERLTEKEIATKRFLARDALGSTTMVFNATGTVEQRYVYEPFGKVNVRDANGNASAASPLTVSLFTGREYDSITSLYNYRHRSYHLSLGRFIQPDPIGFGGGINTYAYVDSDVARHTDPLGLWGFGAVAGGNAEGGVGMVSAGAQASGGVGAFFRGLSPRSFNVGAFFTRGAFARFFGRKACMTSPTGPANPLGAVGAFAGAGWGGFITNADNVGKLQGPFDSINGSLGVGKVKFGFTAAYDDKGTWQISVTTGPGLVASGSSYPTRTSTWP
jgi:RHS repeat-associated protein